MLEKVVLIVKWMLYRGWYRTWELLLLFNVKRLC